MPQSRSVTEMPWPYVARWSSWLGCLIIRSKVELVMKMPQSSHWLRCPNHSEQGGARGCDAPAVRSKWSSQLCGRQEHRHHLGISAPLYSEELAQGALGPGPLSPWPLYQNCTRIHVSSSFWKAHGTWVTSRHRHGAYSDNRLIGTGVLLKARTSTRRRPEFAPDQFLRIFRQNL
jgi:hypothetical protein